MKSRRRGFSRAAVYRNLWPTAAASWDTFERFYLGLGLLMSIQGTDPHRLGWHSHCRNGHWDDVRVAGRRSAGRVASRAEAGRSRAPAGGPDHPENKGRFGRQASAR